jgi:hypothetical protein
LAAQSREEIRMEDLLIRLLPGALGVLMILAGQLFPIWAAAH